MNDLWQHLKTKDRPILLYGMGNGADKILDVCASKYIEISGVFASDGFVRGNIFRNMKVVSYSEAVKRFGDFTVLVSFATSREEVLENILKIGREREIFVPDVPVAGDLLFDGAFYEKNKENFKKARSVLQDEKSKAVFDLVIKSKLTGDLSSLLEQCTTADEDFSEILHPESYKVCGDFGAYTGDTARDLALRCSRLERIISVEPDPKTFKKLSANVENLPVTAVNAALYDKNEELIFTVSGNRGSGLGAAGKKQAAVKGVRGDDLFGDLHPDYLKFDVEGAEKKALEGLSETICRDKPEMLVSAYHRPEDLFDLPLYLHGKYPFYGLYLRRRKGIPAWDINLYAVPKE